MATLLNLKYIKVQQKKPMLKKLTILIFIVLQSSFLLKAQEIFRQISLEEGLSQSTVTCILEDNKGFMWFGTLDGLNKYDGYDITVYRNNPKDTFSITDNAITTLFQDRNNYIWVGVAKGGLAVLDNLTQRFVTFTHSPENLHSIASNVINSIYQDVNGTLWFASDNGLSKLSVEQQKSLLELFTKPYLASNIQFETTRKKIWTTNTLLSDSINSIIGQDSNFLWLATNRGLVKYNTNNNFFTNYKKEEGNSNTLLNNNITSLYLLKNDVLLVGTNYGFSILNTVTNAFTNVEFTDFPYNIADANYIVNFSQDQEDNIWIGTKMGLIKFNFEEKKYQRFLSNPFNENSISVNIITSLLIDNTGILWVGTSLGGVNKLNRGDKKFVTYKNNPFDSNSLNANRVRAFFEDAQGLIWIGTVDGGLNCWDRTNNKFTHFLNNLNDPYSLSDNHVRAIFEDSDGNLWIGTNDGGLNLFDRKKNRFYRYYHEPENSNSLSSNQIYRIFEDSKKNVWIATFGGGVLLMNKQNFPNITFRQFLHDDANNESISDNDITSVIEDNSGNLWFGTYNNGICKWDSENERFIHYTVNKDGEIDRVYSIIKAQDGTLWLGTRGSLAYYDEEKDDFIIFDESYGFPNRILMGVVEDDFGYLWISTNSGISKFSKETHEVKNYSVSDGLQSNEFMIGAYYKTRNGLLLFGGIGGFDAFYPQMINYNPHIPDIVITGFKVFNKEFTLDSVIYEKKVINLKYDQNSFSFDFVAIDYAYSSKNQYAYMLEGVDENWNFVNQRRFASYTNLPPGEYIFKVKGSNNDGIWNETGTSIIVIITPPFWQRTWFKILATTLIIIFLIIVVKIRDFVHDKNKLEVLVEERTRELMKQKEKILEKNEELQQQQEEILAQRDELELQRDIVTQQKKDMTDSIYYAQRIQRAILPPDNYVKTILKEYFIMFKPRDIVSGDFYWIKSKRGKTVIVAADCTGHGVPGAFVSMLGVAFLNEVVGKIFEHSAFITAAEILNQLRKNILQSLNQVSTDTLLSDGMDMALIIIDKENSELQFAGAYNPLILIRNKELTMIKADKMPVGISPKMDIPFTNHVIPIHSGDNLYMYSDGYIDQFGGGGNRKYKSLPFKKLLTDNSDLPMKKQLAALEEEHLAWKGSEQQVDDILVIGIRI